MNYTKSLFYNFLTIYFANHLLPEIVLLYQTRLPHFGSDLPFAAALGILNSLIYPVCKLISQRVSLLRIAVIALALNFAAYAVIKLIPIGIQTTTIKGYLLVSFVVTIGSFATNYFYMRASRHSHVRKSSDVEHVSHSFTKPDDWKNPPS